MTSLRALALAVPLLAAGVLPGNASTGAPSSAQVPADAVLDVLDHEPRLRVFLAAGSSVAVRVDEAVRFVAGDRTRPLGPGVLTFEAVGTTGSRWRMRGGETFDGPGVLLSADRPVFHVTAQPTFGEPRELRLRGDLLIRAEGGEVQLLERVGMETYLPGVVSAEMSSSWPRQALAAQAIVARSYAAARWMERERAAWHLHWHFGVDMAYHGWSEQAEKVAKDIASTRGEVLMYNGFPVLALFHASSGGRTEAFDRVKPGVFAPDGKTPIAAAMPVVDDLAALAGAAGLDLETTHGRWKTDIPLPEVTKALAGWSAQSRDRPRFGTVEGVSIASRHADSGRVDRVSVRHLLDGEQRFTELAATDFRMAVSPVRIRSIWWERCVVASRSPGYLVLEGRGFGHGCGLSQVSAWHLAKSGESAEAIVARFYAGARIERRY